MVSLTVAERIAELARPQVRHAVIAVSDPLRGEKLVLLTEAADSRAANWSRPPSTAGFPKSPCRANLTATQLPLLGSGKTDYVAATALAKETAPTAGREVA